MKQYFLYAIAILIPLAILGWFLYALGRKRLFRCTRTGNSARNSMNCSQDRKRDSISS